MASIFFGLDFRYLFSVVALVNMLMDAGLLLSIESSLLQGMPLALLYIHLLLFVCSQSGHTSVCLLLGEVTISPFLHFALKELPLVLPHLQLFL